MSKQPYKIIWKLIRIVLDTLRDIISGFIVEGLCSQPLIYDRGYVFFSLTQTMLAPIYIAERGSSMNTQTSVAGYGVKTTLQNHLKGHLKNIILCFIVERL